MTTSPTEPNGIQWWRRVPRPVVVFAVLVVAALALWFSIFKPRVHDDPSALQVVSVGDSLSVGVQPNLFGKAKITRQGYPRQFASALRKREIKVQLHELGCGGATSESILAGGTPCAPKGHPPFKNTDPSTSPISYAEGLLTELEKRKRVILLDIGGNDVGDCFSKGRIIAGCYRRAGTKLEINLREILIRLKEAAPGVPIGVFTLYDPLIGLWKKYPQSRALLQKQHRTFIREVNGTIIRVARAQGATIIDLARAMNQDQQLDASSRTLPPAVAAVCKYTWMCAPVIPDIHLRTSGYKLAGDEAVKALLPKLGEL